MVIVNVVIFVEQSHLDLTVLWPNTSGWKSNKHCCLHLGSERGGFSVTLVKMSTAAGFHLKIFGNPFSFQGILLLKKYLSGLSTHQGSSQLPWSHTYSRLNAGFGYKAKAKKQKWIFFSVRLMPGVLLKHVLFFQIYPKPCVFHCLRFSFQLLWNESVFSFEKKNLSIHFQLQNHHCQQADYHRKAPPKCNHL